MGKNTATVSWSWVLAQTACPLHRLASVAINTIAHKAFARVFNDRRLPEKMNFYQTTQFEISALSPEYKLRTTGMRPKHIFTKRKYRAADIIGRQKTDYGYRKTTRSTGQTLELRMANMYRDYRRPEYRE